MTPRQRGTARHRRTRVRCHERGAGKSSNRRKGLVGRPEGWGCPRGRTVIMRLQRWVVRLPDGECGAMTAETRVETGVVVGAPTARTRVTSFRPRNRAYRCTARARRVRPSCFDIVYIYISFSSHIYARCTSTAVTPRTATTLYTHA